MSRGRIYVALTWLKDIFVAVAGENPVVQGLAGVVATDREVEFGILL